MRPTKVDLQTLVDDLAHRKRQLAQLEAWLRIEHPHDPRPAGSVQIYREEIFALEQQIHQLLDGLN